MQAKQAFCLSSTTSHLPCVTVARSLGEQQPNLVTQVQMEQADVGKYTLHTGPERVAQIQENAFAFY